ncbi:hypothetical protein SynNOUM97013_01438 [Synechococcus sp. NOUM97013]|nr:hypothetical protein SynNOUM97013_01438 [Synechococcus sp. NOUM97013]
MLWQQNACWFLIDADLSTCWTAAVTRVDQRSWMQLALIQPSRVFA